MCWVSAPGCDSFFCGRNSMTAAIEARWSAMSVCISPVKWRKTNTRSRLVFLLGKEPLSACCHKWEPCHCEGGDGLGWWRQRGYPAFTKHWDIISKKYVCVQYKLSFFPAPPVFFLQAHTPSLRQSYLNSTKKKIESIIKTASCLQRQAVNHLVFPYSHCQIQNFYVKAAAGQY